MKWRNVSNKLDYGNLFAGWEIALAKGVISDFCGPGKYFDEDDFEDLLQDCLIHWWTVRGRYDGGRGASQQTYMRKIIRNKIRDCINASETNKRKVQREASSLGQPIEDNKDSPILLDRIDGSSSQSAPSVQYSDIDRKIDLARALEKLTPRQKRICQLKMDGRDVTIIEISENLNVSRSTIYDELNRIRILFEKFELQKYIK
jgi:RNA polymerase sigma factor (sigma-70 family)